MISEIRKYFIRMYKMIMNKMPLSELAIKRYTKCAGMAQEFELRARLFYEVRLNKKVPHHLKDVIDGLPLKSELKTIFHKARELRNKLDHAEFWAAEEKVEVLSGRKITKANVQEWDISGISGGHKIYDVITNGQSKSHRDVDEKFIWPWLASSMAKDGLFDEAEIVFDKVIHTLKTI